MSDVMEKRGDDEIWDDYAGKADVLIQELKYALTLAKSVSRKVRENGNIDDSLFRDLERRVYAAYRSVGDMSAVLDEIE